MTITQQDTLAQKLKDGEICQKDLADCKDTFEKDGSCNPTIHFAGGFLGGAVLTFLIIGVLGAKK